MKRTNCVVLLMVLLLAGCDSSPSELESLTDSELTQAFEELHRGIYGVYELDVDRDLIHGLLSDSFYGAALTREYVEHFTTRVTMKRELTSIDVLSVDYETVEVVERSANEARIEADWSIGGVVTHQRHRHARVNRYRAQYTVGVVGSADNKNAALESGASPRSRLRILSTRLKNLERVGSLLEGSSGFPLDKLPSSERGFMTAKEILESGLFDEDDLEADGSEQDAAARENPKDGANDGSGSGLNL